MTSRPLPTQSRPLCTCPSIHKRPVLSCEVHAYCAPLYPAEWHALTPMERLFREPGSKHRPRARGKVRFGNIWLGWPHYFRCTWADARRVTARAVKRVGDALYEWIWP